MKANDRFGLLAFAAGLWLGSPALAQSVTQNSAQNAPPANIQVAPPRPTTTSPSASGDTVGPQELQNFSLGGTVTRPAESRPPATTPSQAVTGPATNVPQATVPAARTSTSRTAALPERTAAAPAAAGPNAQGTAPATAPDLTTVSPAAPATSSPAGTPSPSFTPEPESASTAREASMLPWLLAALVLAAALAFLLWRRRPREVLAGGPGTDSYVPPEPAPTASKPVPSARVAVPAPPAPSPAPAVAPAPVRAAAEDPVGGTIRAFADAPVAPPQPIGIVSTRLRPWLDVTIVPTACQIDAEQVGFEFDIDVFNSGAAPARDILIAASLFNAGPTQEQDIAAFIAQGIGQGDPLPPIPPLQRINFRTALVAQRSSLQLFEAGGRQLFVPVLAFNAMYGWSGGAGQTSGSVLLGRETGVDKLAPLRADTEPRTFGGLGARTLPTGLRK